MGLIKLIFGSENILNNFLKSAKKDDMVLLINKDAEMPMNPLLVQFSEPRRKGSDYVEFNTDKAVSFDVSIEMGDLVLPNINPINKNLSYVVDVFYSGNKEAITDALKSEGLY